MGYKVLEKVDIITWDEISTGFPHTINYSKISHWVAFKNFGSKDYPFSVNKHDNL